MVAGLMRVESTIRNLNCPADQRVPAPLRSGARVPWNRSSGNGPVWQSRQSPTCRLATIARPLRRIALRAGQRCRNGVADDRIGFAARRARRPVEPHATRRRQHARQRDRRSPDAQPKTSSVIVLNQPLAKFASSSRALRGAFAGLTPPAPFTSASCAVARLVDAGDRDAVVGRHQTVAGVDQPRLLRLLAGEQLGDRGGANLGLRIRRERRFRHAAGNAGVADDVDVRLQLRFERHRIDRAPAGLVGDAGELGDARGLLRRDHVGDRRLVASEFGDQRVGLRDRPR